MKKPDLNSLLPVRSVCGDADFSPPAITYMVYGFNPLLSENDSAKECGGGAVALLAATFRL